jgi:hypothetical protein
MTRLQRLIASLRAQYQRFAKTVADKTHLGPHAPPRLAEEVVVFDTLYPDATPEQWRAFATRHAQIAYQDGFRRGFEWRAREWRRTARGPEQRREMARHDWETEPTNPLLRGRNPHDPLGDLSRDQRALLLKQLRATHGTPYQATIRPTPEPADEPADEPAED